MRKFRDVEAVKENLREATDIVSFFSRYLELNQRGERWIGFCPFHDDKNSPGFALSPDIQYQTNGSKGVWACWTCDARGDLFTFVQKMHDASFFEAIGIIAEATGFDLTPYYRELSPEEELREQRLNTIEIIADLFCDELIANKRKMKFFLEKGIEEPILREMKVGWCPSVEYFQEKVSSEVRNFVEPEISNRQRLFANRFVYTQFTSDGRPWGWYARQPDNRAEGVPKYIGTSQKAPLFNGGDRLYGFHTARKLLRGSDLPMQIVEGFHDTLMSQQAGFAAVASCGTQLSAKQEETLRAYSIRKAIVCYDPDDGGRKGMLDIAGRCHKIEGINFQFATVTLEPEEFISNAGADAYRDALQDAVSPIEYIVSSYANLDTSTPTKKRNFLDHIKPFLVLYPRRSLDRALGIEAVASVTNLNKIVVEDYLDEHAGNPLVNLPAELIVLAELAINPAAWITLDVNETDFSLARYRKTYSKMRELYELEAEVNIELLLTFCTNQHVEQEVIETIGKLSSVARNTPDRMARDIRDKAIRRTAQEMSVVMSRQVSDLRSPVNESVAGFMDNIVRSMNGQNHQYVFSSVDAVRITINEMERRALSDGEISGLDLGPNWKWITNMMNGLQAQQCIGIAASSGIGKSMVLSNWVHQLSCVEEFRATRSEAAYPAPQAAGLIVSMEMTEVEMNMRLASIDSGVPHIYVERSRYDNQEQYDAVLASMARIQSARLTWMTGQRSIRDIAMKARILQARGELDYIAIDYIQLLDLAPYSDRWSQTEKYNQASQDMKELSYSLKVPVVYCCQLNRAAMGDDLPTGERVGSAYKIYQDAHVFYVIAPHGDGLIGSLDKSRSGGHGQTKLYFNTDKQTSNLVMREMEAGKESPR